jgi:uncharacterized protein
VAFEFDQNKSDANRTKHGIDFVEAQRIWDDPLAVRVPARSTNEPRAMVIGKIDTKHWAAIVTERGENTRIISVRRARKEEVLRYEGF